MFIVFSVELFLLFGILNVIMFVLSRMIAASIVIIIPSKTPIIAGCLPFSVSIFFTLSVYNFNLICYTDFNGRGVENWC